MNNDRERRFDAVGFRRQENGNIEAQFFLWSKRQMDEAIGRLAVGEHSGHHFVSLHISGRWRHVAESVMLNDLFHRNAMLLPLCRRRDRFAIRSQERIGHIRLNGQIIDGRESSWVVRRWGLNGPEQPAGNCQLDDESAQ